MKQKWYINLTRVNGGYVVTFNKYWIFYNFIKAKIKRFLSHRFRSDK